MPSPRSALQAPLKSNSSLSVPSFGYGRTRLPQTPPCLIYYHPRTFPFITYTGLLEPSTWTVSQRRPSQTVTVPPSSLCLLHGLACHRVSVLLQGCWMSNRRRGGGTLCQTARGRAPWYGEVASSLGLLSWGRRRGIDHSVKGEEQCCFHLMETDHFGYLPASVGTPALPLSVKSRQRIWSSPVRRLHRFSEFCKWFEFAPSLSRIHHQTLRLTSCTTDAWF